MTEREKLQKKRREKAAKLSNPKPRELPSGNWRCEIKPYKISVVHEDPEVAHAMALAQKAGIVAKREDAKAARQGNITLSSAIDNHISIRDNLLSPSTKNGYREIQRNRFHGLMDKKISEISFFDLQAAVNQEAEKVGKKTIMNALALISAVMSDYGIESGIDKLKLPQRKKKPARFYEEAELVELFDLIRGTFIEIPVLLATWLGLRRSEIFGLCWDAVSFDTEEIEIKRTYVKDEEKGYVLRDEMKTAESRRTLHCPGYILSRLDEYQPDHSKRTGRIFTMHPNTPYQTLKDLCERSNLKFVGIHGLRHTNASVMMTLGVMDKYIMAEGGWSTDYTMKNVYQHIFQSGRKDTAKTRDDFFGDISAGINPRKKDE